MATMPSPAGWAALAVVVGLICFACILTFRVLRAPSPPFGEGGYGHGSEADRRRPGRSEPPEAGRDPEDEVPGPRRHTGPELRGREA